jgi:hypothetical protein
VFIACTLKASRTGPVPTWRWALHIYSSLQRISTRKHPPPITTTSTGCFSPATRRYVLNFVSIVKGPSVRKRRPCRISQYILHVSALYIRHWMEIRVTRCYGNVYISFRLSHVSSQYPHQHRLYVGQTPSSSQSNKLDYAFQYARQTSRSFGHRWCVQRPGTSGSL